MGHRTQAHYCPALIHAVSLDGLERRLADVVALVGKRGLHGPAGIFLIATKRWSRLRPFRRHRPVHRRLVLSLPAPIGRSAACRTARPPR